MNDRECVPVSSVLRLVPDGMEAEGKACEARPSDGGDHRDGGSHRAVRDDAAVDGGDGADLTGRPVFGWQERPLPWMYEDPEDYRKDLVKFMEAFWNG